STSCRAGPPPRASTTSASPSVAPTSARAGRCWGTVGSRWRVRSWRGAGPTARDRRPTSAIPTATWSSSSPAEGQAQEGAHDLPGRHRPALGRRLQQAAFGRSQDDGSHRARVEILPERARGRPRLKNLLEGEAELLALPGEGETVVLVAARPRPAREEELGEIRITLSVGSEDDLHRPLQSH